jgi:hypothetical protein
LIGLGFKGFTVLAHKDQTINKIVKVAGDVEGGGEQNQEKEEQKY